MPDVTKVQRNFQVTLPASVRKKIHLKVGDLVQVEATEDGILLRPVETVDRAQTWFWSAGWQAEERKVQEDIRKGRLKTSKNVETFLKDLER